MNLSWRLLEYLYQGGWIMIPLGIASMAMWALIIERFIAFRRFTQGDIGVQDAVHAVKGEPVPVEGYGIRASLVRGFLQLRTGDRKLDKHLLRECSLRIRPQLTKSLAVIAVLAGIAPLLGLLGTVIGMIETFDVISLYGTGNARAMAGGISVALITTQSGLLVAIPGLLLSAAMSRKATKLRTHLEELTIVLEHQV